MTMRLAIFIGFIVGLLLTPLVLVVLYVLLHYNPLERES